MATAGPNSPGTQGGGTGWTNPGNILASDDSRASITLAPLGGSETLWAKNFGFTVPTGATIDNIEVEVEGQQDISSPNGGFIPQITKNNGSSFTDWSASGFLAFDIGADSYKSRSGPLSSWGSISLTAAEVNSANFGVGVRCDAGFASGDCTYQVDHIRVTITYTEATTKPFRRSLLGVGF